MHRGPAAVLPPAPSRLSPLRRAADCASKGHRLLWTTINYLLLPCQRGLRTTRCLHAVAPLCPCVCKGRGNKTGRVRERERIGSRGAVGGEGELRGWWRCKRCYQVVCVRSLRCRPHKSFSIKCHALLWTLCESSLTHTHTQRHTQQHTQSLAEGMAHWLSPNTSYDTVPRLSRRSGKSSLLCSLCPALLFYSLLFLCMHT